MEKFDTASFFDEKAKNADKWIKKNRYYYNDLEKICRFLIPENSDVFEIGFQYLLMEDSAYRD